MFSSFNTTLWLVSKRLKSRAHRPWKLQVTMKIYKHFSPATGGCQGLNNCSVGLHGCGFHIHQYGKKKQQKQSQITGKQVLS